jgi:hypothetical protein
LQIIDSLVGGWLQQFNPQKLLGKMAGLTSALSAGLSLYNLPLSPRCAGAVHREVEQLGRDAQLYYTPRIVAYRLRSGEGGLGIPSPADVREWLPGTWEEPVEFTLRDDLPAGRYQIEVAILDRAGTNPGTAPLPPLQLAIEGRGDDGWYALSEVGVD